MSFIKDTFDAITGRGAEKAAGRAADTSAAAQMEALNYLREREQIPRQYSESALQMLGGLYGVGPFAGGGMVSPGVPGGQAGGGMAGRLFQRGLDGLRAQGGDAQGGGAVPGVSGGQAMQSLQSSPIYQAALGDIGAQEEAILRNQSATGALRGGATDQMLAENQRLNQYQATQAALQGIQGLAGLPSNANQIAQGMAGIGQTQAQGMIAGAQARQQGIGQTLGLGLNALSLAGFSDIRLKTNIQHVGQRYGQDWFTWDWNDKAKPLGLTGSAEGVIADKVELSRPELVGEREGYKTVDYEALING